MSINHFIDINQFNTEDLNYLLNLAKQLKANKASDSEPLKGKTLAQIYEKPSTRTRISFEMAMRSLGGNVMTLNREDMQLGRGESISDTAKVMSRFIDVIVLRANSHNTLTELAANATVPVINGLTDKSHPCQILADLLTFEEHKGSIDGKKIAWLGDGNNVLASWIHAAGLLNFELHVSCPKGLEPSKEDISLANAKGAKLFLHDDPEQTAKDADCVITDTWFSMGIDTNGDEDHKKIVDMLMPYQVTEQLMAKAKADAIFMHCLPAHRGEEVVAEVIDGKQSVVFDEAENRMHAQKAVIHWCLLGKQ